MVLESGDSGFDVAVGSPPSSASVGCKSVREIHGAERIPGDSLGSEVVWWRESLESRGFGLAACRTVTAGGLVAFPYCVNLLSESTV